MSKAKLKASGVPSESAEQKWVIQWSQQPSIREKYPELAMLYHIPNERTDKVQAAILKTMGVKTGVPDLHLPIPAGNYHGLYIEMKALDGKPDSDQLWWADHLKANGYFHAFCYGWKQAAEVLLWYLKGCRIADTCDTACTAYARWWDARMEIVRKKVGA